MSEPHEFVVSIDYDENLNRIVVWPDPLPKHFHVTTLLLRETDFMEALYAKGYVLDPNHIHTDHMNLKGMYLRDEIS